MAKEASGRAVRGAGRGARWCEQGDRGQERGRGEAPTSAQVAFFIEGDNGAEAAGKRNHAHSRRIVVLSKKLREWSLWAKSVTARRCDFRPVKSEGRPVMGHRGEKTFAGQ